MLLSIFLSQLAFGILENVPQAKVLTDEYDVKTERFVPTEAFHLTRTKFSNIKDTASDGGAIYISGNSKVNCSINDCLFESCSARNGGAIYLVYQKNAYNFNISDSTFTGCQATTNGGAFYISNNQYKLKQYITILRCTITSNKAEKGGAIYGEVRDQVYIQSCTFKNNEATSGSSFYCIFGQDNVINGGEDDTLVISDCSFTFQPTESNKINIHIETKAIIDTTQDGPCTDLYLGGCTFAIDGETIADMKHLELIENEGGFKTINFDKCNCVKGPETTFSIPSKFTPITNAQFDCTSIETCVPALKPTEPTNPTKPTDPTSPDVKPTPDVQPTPEITPDPNYKQETERIEEPLEEVTLKNVEYFQSTSQYGGAIYFNTKRVNCTIENCKFTLCSSTNGGAINIQYAGEGVYLHGKLSKSTFSYCSAKTDGGAINLKIKQPKIQSFLIEDCTFISNTAGDQGGAIYAEGRDQLTIQRCTFENNKANNMGSSLYVKIGYDAKNDKSDTVILNDNKFIFKPETDSSNVYIETPTSSNNYKNAVLQIGGCQFGITEETDVKYLHLKLFEGLLYQSIDFTKCNCVQQGPETVSVPESAYPIKNFDFNCNLDGGCNADTPITLPPPEGPDADGYTPHDRIVNQGQKIELEKAKFQNLKDNTVEGGAILIKNPRVDCTLVDCKFTSCAAKIGGAIYLSYTGSSLFTCLITGTTFNGCSATQNGGAIYIKITQENQHTVTVNDCKFISNTAGTNGGAIYADARDSFTLKNSQFENNDADVGSSLWCQVGYNNENDPNYDYAYILANTFSFSPKENSTNVYIKSAKISKPENLPNANLVLSLCSFSSVNAKSEKYKQLVIYDSEAKFNSIDFPSCICIQQNNEKVTLPSACKVENFNFNCQNLNSCGPDSDGLLNHDQIIDQKEPIEIESAKFLYHDNSNGGAISINNEKVNCTIKKCKFDICSSEYGGAIYIKYSGNDDNYTCIITDTIFNECKATKHGGAIYIYITQSARHYATVTGCTFTKNEAGSNGGAIYADARDGFTLKNCVFEDNVAPNNGSSLWCRMGWNDRYNRNVATIQDNQFIFTPSTKGEVNVYISSYTLNVDVTPNANLVFGGNTFNAKESKITSFVHLRIYNYKSQFESLNFTSCSCIKQENTNTVDLPLLYKPEYYFTFGCSNMGSCNAKPGTPTPKPTPGEDGYYPSIERINRVEFDPKVVLTKVKFSNLSPENKNYYGGAIYLNKVPATINDCKFEKCYSVRGGGIYVAYSGTYNNYTCTLFGCEFINCNSTTGGAIYASIVQPKRHYISIEGCTFTENTASTTGGAIYATVRDCFDVKHCLFNNNKALNGSSVWCQIGQDQGKDSGDAALFYGNNFTFTPSESNTINIYIQSNELKDETSPNANIILGKNVFVTVNSNAQNYKHLEIRENGKFESIQFSDCNCIQATESTVNIVASEKPDTTNLIYNCQNFDQCPSDGEKPPTTDECKNYPGRQESFRQEVSVEKACFTNIRAPVSSNGGAICVVNAKIEAEDCRFTNCSSDSNGGAIYVSFTVTDCELEIEDCIFKSCTAGNGGAIYFVNIEPSCESSIESCRFENNTAVSNGGAFYYSPCANSEMKKNLFINNSCTSSKAQGSSLYVYVANQNQQTLRMKNKLIKDDDDDDDKEVKPVVMEGNRFRSEPVAQSQQLYINLKKSGQLEFNSNAFSFNKAEEIPNGAKYIHLSKDEGAVFNVNDWICIDNKDSLVSGFDSSVNIQTDCHKADPENDHELEDDDKGRNKNSKLGLIIGVSVAAVVVVVIIVVVVVFVVLRKKQGNYVSDLNNDDIADNDSMAQATTEEPHDL